MEELPVIMVVEDDHLVQTMVEAALVDGGFEPAIAASGEEAVTLLMGEPFPRQVLGERVSDISGRANGP